MPQRFVRERPIAASLLLTLLVSLPFVLAPGLDLAASRLFFDSETGFAPGFFDRRVRAVRTGARVIEAAVGLGLLAPPLLKLAFPDRPLLVSPRVSLFGLSSFLVGTVLVVDLLLKEHWGRSRPRYVEAFEAQRFLGEAKPFSPAWTISGSCPGNCSFVSSEVSAAAWLAFLGLVAPPRWRVPLLVAAALVTAAVGLARMAAGGHFLSDVLIAAALMLVTLAVAWRLVMQGLPPAFDARAERELARLGRRLRAPLSRAFAWRRPRRLHAPPRRL